jgi:Transposase DDE domain
MVSTISSPSSLAALQFSYPMAAVLLQPLTLAFNDPAVACFRRACPRLPDDLCVLSALIRYWHGLPSGRALLQSIPGMAPEFANLADLDRTTWFDSLSSTRRLHLLKAIDDHVRRQAMKHPHMEDTLSSIPELANFEIWAADGHWHAAALHDDRGRKGTKLPCGHIYMLNLRTHLVRHLIAGDKVSREKEHDMRGLKRATAKALRLDTPMGRKTLTIYDRAANDYDYWQNAKQSQGIYFIGLLKCNSTPVPCGFRPWDKNDPRNSLVISDQQVGLGQRMWRLITVRHFSKPDETIQIITTEMDLPPGIIASLYKWRWDIERFFDELKNTFNQKRSWSSSERGKETQARIIALGHNLGVIAQAGLTEAGVIDTAETARRYERTALHALEAKIILPPHTAPTVPPPPGEEIPDHPAQPIPHNAPILVPLEPIPAPIIQRTPTTTEIDSDAQPQPIRPLPASQQKQKNKKHKDTEWLDDWRQRFKALPEISLHRQAVLLVASHRTCLGVKFVRWLRVGMFTMGTWASHLKLLQIHYAEL